MEDRIDKKNPIKSFPLMNDAIAINPQNTVAVKFNLLIFNILANKLIVISI